MTEPHDTHTNALPVPGAGPAMRMLDVAAIVASGTNPRKTFNAAALQELANSIAASGVHQPVLVRPLPANRVPDTYGTRRRGQPLPTHELVAGERRWRACQLASVQEIPAMIRELTDAQVLEIQIVENLQREDVSELEEAEGYGYLMQQTGLNAEEVGNKIGKSRSYVYARLKLLDLCQEGRESLREGKIDASKALLLARIPDHTLQLKALGVIEPDDFGNAYSYRYAASYIQKTFMLRLEYAAFDTACTALLPGAGACGGCHKRTGFAPELFADVKGADICTDTACYRAKEDAHGAHIRSEALARGQTVIDGREAKELMPNSWSSRVEGYLRLDDASDSPTAKPLRALIGKAMEQRGVQATLVANPHAGGALVAVLLPGQVNELLKAQGHADAADKLASEATHDEKTAALARREEARTRYEQTWRWDVLEAAWCKLAAHPALPTDAVLRHLATDHAKALNVDRAKRLCKLLDLGKVDPVAGVEQWAANHPCPGAALQLLVMEADVNYRPWLADDPDSNAGLLLVAAAQGLDLDTIKSETKANLRADAARAAAAAKSASTPCPAAQASSAREAVAEEVRGKGKGKAGEGARAKTQGKTGPAAHARAAAPKTSKAQASAAIAAALAEAEGDIVQAPSAQGNEAGPVAGALDPSAGQTQTGAGAGDGAAMSTQSGEEAGTCALALGMKVRVLATATHPKQLPHVGKVGSIYKQIGPQAWDVAVPGKKGGMAKFVGFHSTELEMVP